MKRKNEMRIVITSYPSHLVRWRSKRMDFYELNPSKNHYALVCIYCGIHKYTLTRNVHTRTFYDNIIIIIERFEVVHDLLRIINYK